MFTQHDQKKPKRSFRAGKAMLLGAATLALMSGSAPHQAHAFGASQVARFATSIKKMEGVKGELALKLVHNMRTNEIKPSAVLKFNIHGHEAEIIYSGKNDWVAKMEFKIDLKPPVLYGLGVKANLNARLIFRQKGDDLTVIAAGGAKAGGSVGFKVGNVGAEISLTGGLDPLVTWDYKNRELVMREIELGIICQVDGEIGVHPHKCAGFTLKPRLRIRFIPRGASRWRYNLKLSPLVYLNFHVNIEFKMAWMKFSFNHAGVWDWPPEEVDWMLLVVKAY